MIIDPHVHVGHDTTFDSNRTEAEVIRVMDRAGIDAAVVQPAQFVTFAEFQAGHDRIHRFAQAHPGRIFGMASLNPHWDLTLYKDEVTRCIRELGFVGLKVTPITHAWNPLVQRGRVPFETARELGMPLMCHVSGGLPFSLASNLYDLVREFSDVRVVLAHSGALWNADECLVLAREFPNVYLETSVRTSNSVNIRHFVRGIGAQRVMFASDSPDEMEHGIWMVRHAGLSSEEVDWVLGRASAGVFNIADKVRH